MRTHILYAVAAIAALCDACGKTGLPDGAERSADHSRIAVFGPALAETLDALGLSERVVAVDDYCVTSSLADRPRVGGLLNPHAERLLGTSPDLVLVQGSSPDLRRLCRAHDLPFEALKVDTCEEWEQCVATLGVRFGRLESARELIAESRRALAAVAGAAPDPPISCAIIVGRRAGSASGLVAAGGSSFLSELLNTAGGQNIFADAALPYFDVAEEVLLARAPAVILELRPGGNLAEPAAEALLWEPYASVPAVRDGRVHLLSDESILLPGPSMAGTAQLLQEALLAGHGRTGDAAEGDL